MDKKIFKTLKVGELVKIVKNDSAKYFDRFIGKIFPIQYINNYSFVVTLDISYGKMLASTLWSFEEIEQLDEIQRKLE